LGAIVYGLIESSRLGLQSHSHKCVGRGHDRSWRFRFGRSARASSDDAALALSLREFRWANLLTLFLYAALAGTLYFMPLNLIQVQGYSATAAGARLCRLS